MIRRWIAAIIMTLGFQAALLAVLQATAFGEGSQVITTAPPCVNPGGTGGCYSKIQAAINAASYGDVIDVAAGTYPEHITMVDGVSVHGQGWPSTIIDGGHIGQVVYFPPGISESTVLSGVRIYRGGAFYTTPQPTAGGGIHISDGSPSIVNTWVNSCTAMYGGGVYVNTGSSGSPTFDNVPVWNCQAKRGGGFYVHGDVGGEVTITANPFGGITDGTVYWNSATDEGGGFYMYRYHGTVSLAGLRVFWNTASDGGGGAYITSPYPIPGRTTLLLNQFFGNTVTGSASRGAGIAAYNASDLQVLGNWISSNTASGGGDGGGAYFSECAGAVRTNWFLDNTAGGDGGGASVSAASPGLTLDANIFVSNTAQGGGGISLDQAGAVLVTNNILVQNTASLGDGGGVLASQSPGQIINNTIADNTGDGVFFASSGGVAIVNNIISGNSGDGIERDASNPTTLYTAEYNDLYLNIGGNYENLNPGTGDMTQDPKFVGAGDAFQYYHIQGTSPVKETGDPVRAPDFDIDWEARLFGETVSMGADEIPVAEYHNFLPLILRSY